MEAVERRHRHPRAAAASEGWRRSFVREGGFLWLCGPVMNVAGIALQRADSNAALRYLELNNYLAHRQNGNKQILRKKRCADLNVT